jgi:hypothetical protein
MHSTLDLPQDGLGKDGFVEVVKEVLRWSVNTWDQGFMDKLYASTDAVGPPSWDPKLWIKKDEV